MDKKFITNFLIVVMLMVLFIGTFIGFSVVKRVNRPNVLSDEVTQRYETLDKVKEAQMEKISHYAWEDKDNGVVRIPLERAIELTLNELGGTS